MSSMIRNIQRKNARKSPDYEPRSRSVQYLPNGGYRVLRETKGWLTVSPARLRAQARLAEIRARIHSA